MINILFNAEHPAPVFAMAAFIMNLEEKYNNDIIDFIPIKARDLLRTLSDLVEIIDDDIDKLESTGEEDDSIEDEPDNEDYEPVKYALFGIYPKTKADEKAIASFFYDNSERIMLWIDWHEWPENLASYVKLPENIFFNRIKTCLEVLSDEGYIFPQAWSKSEKAMLSHNLEDPLAARYWKAFLVSKSVGFNNFANKGADFLLFSSIIEELILNKENEIITNIEQSFDLMESEKEELVARISDDNPLFKEAKEIGRSVGYLFLEDVPEYFDARDILKRGTEKFPWLCVVRYLINGLEYVHFESEKFPVDEIMRSHEPLPSENENVLKIIKAELLCFKEVK
ncbi:MAG: hypothetical protein ACOYL8_02770 [Patescibacteria group bacterium]